MEKITIAQNFDLVINFLVDNGADVSLVEFLQDRKAKSQKKKGVSAEVIVARADFDSIVLSALTNEPQTVTEVFASMGYPEGVSTSKITASLGRLIAEGSVENNKEKGKSYYKLVG